MSTLVSYEPLVDQTTTVFLEQTQKLFCQTGQSCDFARWLQFYAFDVIGQITFSKRFGFVDQFEDVDGIVEAIAGILKYSGTVSTSACCLSRPSADDSDWSTTMA